MSASLLFTRRAARCGASTMAFFPPVSHPKMRQEGFHLPSPPSSSAPNPPSPSSSSFDLFFPHGHPPNDARYPALALPEAFSRTNSATMDFGDDLASLIAGPVTSNEREPYRPPHNIFDISAPPSAHYHNQGAHAYSLPHTHRPDLTPLSQPASLHNSYLDHHQLHQQHQQQQHHHQQQQLHHHPGLSRDGFPAHFNSTIPPLSTGHDYDPPPPHMAYNGGADPYTPVSTHMPPRDTPSPSSTTTSARPDTSHGGRSVSRSRSRAAVRSGSATGVRNVSVNGSGPTRTTKSTSKRRDSLTLMSHQHPLHPHAAHHLPSPPSRPQAIVIPSQSHAQHQSSARTPVSPLTNFGPSGGWFLPPSNGTPTGGGEYSLPTPESMPGNPYGFGASVGSMGISPKDTTSPFLGNGVKSPNGNSGESSPVDPATKQAALVNEKRRRRRESHNAVERRRRDNINEKISELATLIPEVMLDPGATVKTEPSSGNLDDVEGEGEGSSVPPQSAPQAQGSGSQQSQTAQGQQQVKANKGMILRKSVEYIRYLQQLVDAQATRNRELEERLAKVEGPSSNGTSSGASGSEHGANENAGDLSFCGFGSDNFGLGIGTSLSGMLSGMGMDGMIGMGMNGHGHGSELEAIRQEEDVKPALGDRAPNGDGNHDGGMDVEISFLGHGQGHVNGNAIDHPHYHGLTNGFSLGLGNGLTTAHRKFGDVKCENSPPNSNLNHRSGHDRDDSGDADDGDVDEDGAGATPEGSGSASVSAEDHEDRDRGDDEELEQRGRRGRDGRPGIQRHSSVGKRELFGGSTGVNGRMLRGVKEESEEEERMEE